MSVVKRLKERNLISPPKHVTYGTHYEVIMGSVAYGVSSDTSDVDIYGFSIPYKDIIFPHLKREILGFGRQTQRFEQYQQHHVKDKEAKKEYDITIYSIVKFFQLCMDNNPNMIDSLFVPFRCIINCTPIGNLVRENRHLFLHKGAFFKYKGYSFSQLHKIKTKNPEGKRKEIVKKHGYDTKYAMHLVRLLGQIEQILIEGDLDLERNREQLKSIRRGEWTEERVTRYFEDKEKQLEELYTKSELRHSPNESAIKELLIKCLEMEFGDLSKVIPIQEREASLLEDLEDLIHKYKGG